MGQLGGKATQLGRVNPNSTKKSARKVKESPHPQENNNTWKKRRRGEISRSTTSNPTNGVVLKTNKAGGWGNGTSMRGGGRGTNGQKLKGQRGDRAELLRGWDGDRRQTDVGPWLGPRGKGLKTTVSQFEKKTEICGVWDQREVRRGMEITALPGGGRGYIKKHQASGERRKRIMGRPSKRKLHSTRSDCRQCVLEGRAQGREGVKQKEVVTKKKTQRNGRIQRKKDENSCKKEKLSTLQERVKTGKL